MYTKQFSSKSILILLVVLVGLLLPEPAVAQETIIYSQGFESDNGSYTVTGNINWEWGSPSVVGPTSANSGVNCWGTDLDDNFTSGEAGTIDSPAIAIPGLAGNQTARVRFYAYTNIDMNSRGQFFVSSDGVTWNLLSDFYMTMLDGWMRFEFDVSSYAGGNLYLRFSTTAWGTAPGFYIDDVSVSVVTYTGDQKLFTLEASESSGSCPWINTWDGENFVGDNDVYSVARYSKNEYKDYYLLQRPLVRKGEHYVLELQEVENEESYTDLVGLIAVDHSTDVAVAPDDRGNVIPFHPKELKSPVTVINKNGKNMVKLLNKKDNQGFHAYSTDTLDVSFGKVDVSDGARLVLRVKGFLSGKGKKMPYIGPPAVVLQVPGSDDSWQEVGRLKPRVQWSECAFDLYPYLKAAKGEIKIRLLSISHAVKYHEIDTVALSTGKAPEVEISQLSLLSATAAKKDVIEILNQSDDNYLNLTPGNKAILCFKHKPQTKDTKRDFIFISEGYYVPGGGTYFLYFWDGSNWVLKDGFSYPSTDDTHVFDVSAFLPDADGEYKVRVWQDYNYSGANMDFVQLQVGALTGTLNYAMNVRDNIDILTQMQASDDTRYAWSGDRNRFAEFRFINLPVNTPPAVNPVSVSGRTISWNYTDADSDPQAQYEVEIWTQPGALGTNMWDPTVMNGTSGSTVYPNGILTPGVTYYARVRANDGQSWGPWSERSFSGVAGVCRLTIETGPGGTTNPSPGRYTHVAGTNVEVRALADNGYKFTGWSGDVPGGSVNSNPVTINMSRSKTIIANFIKVYTLDLSCDAKMGSTHPETGLHLCDAGSTVTIIATPAQHHEFCGWIGDVPPENQSDNPLSLTANSDMALTACFRRMIYAPGNLIGEKVLNRSLAQAEYISVLKWTPNANNVDIIKYRIYRLENSTQTLAGEVNASTHIFMDRKVLQMKEYIYAVVAVNFENREGSQSTIVVK